MLQHKTIEIMASYNEEQNKSQIGSVNSQFANRRCFLEQVNEDEWDMTVQLTQRR
jgi:hypothetical protein